MPSSAIPVAGPVASAGAVRVQRSVLTGLEKRVLRWLAIRMPRAVNSDHMTLLALVAMLGAGGSYWLAASTSLGLALATVCLALNWFGDSLDGTLARVREQQRPRYGYYVDHVVDAIGALALFGGLAVSGYMSPVIAAALVITYFLLCLEVYLASHAIGRFQMSFFGFGPTELRVLVAIGNVALLVRPVVTLFGQPFNLFDVGGAIGATGLAVTFVYSAIRNTRLLYREEPVPPAPTPADGLTGGRR